MPRIALSISLLLALSLSMSCSRQRTDEFSGEVSIASLWRLCTERSIVVKDDIYVCGYVVANDRLRELNRSIVIADNSGGIELKIDCDNIDYVIPLFSKVMLRCSGLSIGREGTKVVMGATPTQEYVVDRIAESHLLHYVKVIELPDSPPVAVRLTPAELDAYMSLRLVDVDNLQLIDEELGTTWCEPDTIRPGRYLTTVRHFVSGSDTLRIVTDKECTYANDVVPYGRCSVRGIVDWYGGDIALRISAHTISKSR